MLREMLRSFDQPLRIVYKDENGISTFEDLLQKDDKVHDRNLKRLAIEMFKVKNNLTFQGSNQ